MQKQIFIPRSDLTNELNSVANRNYSKIVNIGWLGLVNQHLGDKANAKEILSVEYVNRENLFTETEGYVISYLESEMIANRDDLENSFRAGRRYYFDFEIFDDWFNENFK